jgi:hypothetical protein
MSDDHEDRGSDDVAPTDGSGVEGRVAGAMASFATHVRPEGAAWERIDERLDARSARPFALTRSGVSPRRPVLVAAAIVVLVVLAGSIVVRARTTDLEVQVATGTTGAEQVAIVAVTADSRLVELGLDGRERRELYRVPDDGSRLEGRIGVSPHDGVVYVARTRPSGTCPVLGSRGEASVPQIVAVPYAGGDPAVVVDAGYDPDVDPATGRLTYLAPAASDGCSSGEDTEIGLFDPASRATMTLGRADSASGATPAGPTALSIDLPWAVPSQVRWSPAGDAVWSLVHYGSGVDMRALVRTRVSFDGADFTPGSTEVLLRATALQASTTDAGPSAGFTDELFALTSFSPVVESDHTDSFVGIARGGTVGGLVASRWSLRTLEPGNMVIGYGSVGEIDASQLGASPFVEGDVDVDASTGDLVVVAGASTGAGILEPPVELHTAGPDTTTSPGVDPEPTSVVAGSAGSKADGVLVVIQGGKTRVVTDGIVSATWIRTVDDALVVATTPTTAFPPGTTGTIPPESVPSTGVEVEPTPGTPPPGVILPAPTTEVPADAVEGSERPDDAAAITDAFRAFFEQGDQAALEGSGILEPALDEGAKTVPNGGKGVTVTIDAITFTGDDEAEVRFRLDQSGNFFTAATIGSAVFVDGRWKVSAATMCTLLSRVRIACPTAP